MLRTITPAANDPVTLSEAKAHLRVDFPDDDALISALISAATLYAQAHTQRLFITQTVETILSCWPSEGIVLPVAPVDAANGVVSVKFYDQNDLQQTWDASQYIVRQEGPTARIIRKWQYIWPLLSVTPAAEPIVVRFIAGQSTAPENVKAAIKLLVGHIYNNREAAVIDARAAAIVAPFAVDELLRPEVWA